MSIDIIVYATEYAPWEEDADEREVINEWSEEHTFDTARECATWLEREGFGEPSGFNGHAYDLNTWLDAYPYEHPYTGVLTERSAHVSGNANPRVWSAIVASVSHRRVPDIRKAGILK
jgi:hypothetical protein